MGRVNSFIAIFIGNDGKYYSAHQWNLAKIPNQEKAKLTDMVYARQTNVIYYEVHNGKKVVSRHPFISENGKFCCFIDGNFVEIS